jgi:hypothetical protein
MEGKTIRLFREKQLILVVYKNYMYLKNKNLKAEAPNLIPEQYSLKFI